MRGRRDGRCCYEGTYPYGRFLSFYRHWIVDPSNRRILDHYKKFGVYEDMPFGDCVRAITGIDDLGSLESHAAPQFWFVLRGHSLRVKFVGRLERINTDIAFVNRACGIEGELLYRNRSGKDTAGDPYTPDLRRLVFEFYRTDFELFGYDAGGHGSS